MDNISKIQFFYVDPNYISYLQTVDPHVPNVIYLGRHKKMLCGAVFKLNGVSYYAPLSHKTVSSSFSFIIRGERNEPIASLRTQYMIPVPESVLSKVDIVQLMKDDIKYGDLVLREYRFCNRPGNVGAILKKAEKAYRAAQKMDNNSNCHCCNFAALEAAMQKYQLSEAGDNL
ncbi:MAG: type III toxin-antitoxin system ToxN/AbiQ family toxin [Oscillospiraceae bacterium]|nr:type III toxin-antitoxin system ToxN/AbiQ family toxin [Oscillospiraceae bacterium]